MNRHESNDPREGQREQARQSRLTRSLAFVIGVLVSLITATLFWRYGLFR